MPNENIWLNSQYINTKWNWKLGIKFFSPFQVLHLIAKQVYKLELFAKWKIYDVFNALLLKQDTIRKEKINQLLDIKSELDSGDDKEYEVEAICNSKI